MRQIECSVCKMYVSNVKFLHHLELQTRVPNMDLVTGAQLNAAHSRGFQAATVAKDAGPALAPGIVQTILAALGVVAYMGMFAGYGCLRLREGHIVAPPQPVLFADHLFQPSDVHTLR